MPKNKVDTPSKGNVVVKDKRYILEAQRASYLQRMQSIYDEIPDSGQDESVINRYIVRCLNIEDIRTEFMELVKEINILGIEDKIEPNYEFIWSFTDLYNAVISTRDSHLSAQKAVRESASATFTLARASHVKLPRIQLKQFDGELRDWPLFIQTFNVLIHENTELSDTERVQYLLSSLVGKAQNVCSGLTPTPANYLPIYNALIAKYQDNRALATSFLDQLLDLKSITEVTPQKLDYFIDKFTTSYAALNQLEIKKLDEFIFIHIGLRKLDADTIKAFENAHRNADSMPSYKEFVSFIRDQVKVLERTQKIVQAKQSKPTSHLKISHSLVATPTALKPLNKNCPLCEKHNHSQLYECTTFKAMTVNQRFEFVKSQHGCVNCLSTSHTSYTCNSQQVCKKCQRRHHSMLHFEAPQPQPSTSMAAVTIAGENSTEGVMPTAENLSCEAVALASCTTSSSSSVGARKSNVLLSTAQVLASHKGSAKQQKIRCLVDSGSQDHLMTTSCCRKLKLHVTPLNNSVIKGIGMGSRPIHGYTTLTIESRVYPHKYDIQVLVVDCITGNLPARFIDTSQMSHLQDVPLADAEWNVPGQIEVVLGAQLFPYLLLGGRIDAPYPVPPLLETTLGYILMGQQSPAAPPIDDTAVVSTTFLSLSNNDLHASLQRFWELEEVPKNSFLSPEDMICENDFRKNVKRDNNGNYTVALPFDGNEQNLGNSRGVAHKRFLSLERKFKTSPPLHESYNGVIKDYLEKGFLEETPPMPTAEEGYFIPHHAVIRPDKSTTKVRPVLDASAKTSSGLSLNDVLHTGPNLQADLFQLLMKFRHFPVAITADIRQMYLCIGVTDDHRKYQKILYRFDSAEVLRCFQFTCVPFGLKCSPYLAMRTIRQLASDERENYPAAAAIAESELYMDDLVTSVKDTEVATDLSRQLIDLFKLGGFDLVKWASNSPELLSSLPSSHCAPIDFSASSSIKILGLSWNPKEDVFSFTSTPEYPNKCTKRIILSTVARLFDVLGLVSPTVVYAKLLIKELWNENLGWDDVTPAHISEKYVKFMEELPLLSNLKISRHLHVTDGRRVNLIAFCDASMKAYGAVIYFHVVDAQGNVFVELVCSKSRVSPVKVVTLARLELCAALLLSKLARLVYDTFNPRYPIDNIFAFSDSTIALSWIHSSPHRWSIFVSNRVAKIHENIEPKCFYHVPGNENPSDTITRGMLPSQLLTNDLWWHGPPWMMSLPSAWPIRPFYSAPDEEVPEIISTALITTTVQETSVLYSLAQRISNYNRLLRIVVYTLRFVKVLPRSDNIVSDEINAAETRLIAAVQKVHFAEEIKELHKGILPQKFKGLDAFIDAQGLLRVGGRLNNADLPFEVQHPILLPKKEHLVNILVDEYHRKNCHTGSNLLSSIIKQKFWILSSRNVIRQRVRLCNFCFKVNPKNPWPKMANLPSCRVAETKAFANTGVDYAGPINITLQRRRGQRSQKAYLCVFICLSTKAVHIEVASDLSTDTFLDAFKRFISRRGPVSCMYSDNGTNFIGAKTKLDDLFALISSDKYRDTLLNELNCRRISWKVIPPHAPHFGGMWESTVKCFKTHLYRVVGDHLLTYEELLTVLTQVEALLNSRPLCVLSEDPYPEVLTPAHFLMTSPLQFLPALDVSQDRLSILDRKKLLDQMVQSYWKKWRLEYLHTLQVRQKWCSPANVVKEGTIVTMMQDDVPPLRWPLAIVEEVHPGADGITRVATVKTRTGSYKRPVVKLCPIPNQ